MRGVFIALSFVALSSAVGAASTHLTIPGVDAVFPLKSGVNAVTRGACRVAVDRTCTILLQPDEAYKTVMGAPGCAVQGQGQCPWRYDSPAVGSKDAAVVLVPNFDNLNTNVVIFTDRRVYDVALSSDGTGDQVIAFGVHARKVAAVRATRPVWATPTPVPECKIPPPQPSAEEMDQLVSIAQADAPRWSAWDPDYRISGSADFRPLWAATDGERTILAMPSVMAIAPSVYVMVNSKLVSATPQVQGRLWLIEGVQSDVLLRVADNSIEVRRGR